MLWPLWLWQLGCGASRVGKVGVEPAGIGHSHIPLKAMFDPIGGQLAPELEAINNYSFGPILPAGRH